MKFSDYSSKKKTEKISSDNKKLLMSLLKDYEGKSQDEIIASIIQIATEKRRNGTLSDAELDSFYSMLLPMVNAEQKKTLDSVMAKLKSI